MFTTIFTCDFAMDDYFYDGDRDLFDDSDRDLSEDSDTVPPSQRSTQPPSGYATSDELIVISSSDEPEAEVSLNIYLY